MCKYCEPTYIEKKVYVGLSRTKKPKYEKKMVPEFTPLETEFISELIIQGNKLCLYYAAYSCDSSFSEELEIKFCPMCGRRLEK